MTEKDNLWVKYSTGIGLHYFLKGCVKGCRKQWETVKKNSEELFTLKSASALEYQEKNHELLFNCFLYAFCQNQVAIILNPLASILENQTLKDLYSQYKNHFKSFKVVANGMKHLNTEVGKLIKKNETSNIQFYNLFGTILTFGDASVDCFSEKPLKKTEEVFEKADPIIVKALEKLHQRCIIADQNS